MTKQTIATRIEDKELLTRLEEKAEQHGSRSEAVRQALRTALLENEPQMQPQSDLPRKAAEGLQALREFCDVGERIEIDTAESIISQELQISKRTTRRAVIKPLVDREHLNKHQTMRAVFVDIATTDTGGVADD